MEVDAVAGNPAAAAAAAAVVPELPAEVEAACANNGPEAYFMVTTVSKRHNLGNIMRSCCALGVKEILAVGKRKEMSTFGAQGTQRFIPVRFFKRVQDAVDWLKERGIAICGIEIVPEAKPVHKHPFTGSTCFVPGAEGHGLTESEKAICDFFVYIPHHGNGTASLNVVVASSIVLHHFAVWAQFAEIAREEGRDKFAVIPKAGDVVDPEQQARVQQEREAERAEWRACPREGEGEAGLAALINDLEEAEFQESEL